MAEIGRSDFSNRLQEELLRWRSVPCMRKVVQLTDRRSPFQLESVEKFAIMPSSEDLNKGHGGSFPIDHPGSDGGPNRFCTCRATTPTSGDDTEEKETVCRVADERANMSQEAAESLCLERNRREAALLRDSTNEKDIESAFRGCAGFMSFTPLSQPLFDGSPEDAPHDDDPYRTHPKANHVLFFSGNQTVTGIAATKEQYKQKGGKFWSLASSYLNPWDLAPWDPKRRETWDRILGDVDYSGNIVTWTHGKWRDEPIGKWRVVRPRADYLPRCVYYVGDKQTERTEVSGNLGQAERMEVLFNVAVGGVAVFSIALLVVAVFLVAACRKHQKSRRALGGRDVGKERKAKQELRSRDQTNRDGPKGAARVVHDEKAPQTPTLPLASVPKDEKGKPTTPTRKKESTKKRDHAGAPPWQRRAGAPSAPQVHNVAKDVHRGFPTRYADYRLDVRDQQPLPLQRHHLRAVRAIGIGQGVEDGGGARGEADYDARGVPLALGNNDPVAFPEPLTQTRQAIMGLQMESQEGSGEVPLPVNPRAHSTGEVGREGEGTRQVLERATRAAVSSASLSLQLGHYEAQPEELLLGRGDGEIDVDWLLALAPNANGDGTSCTDTVPVAPVNSSVTGKYSRPTSETPEGASWRWR